MNQGNGKRVLPLYGVAVVFRQQRRGRSPWRDLLGVSCHLVGLVALSAIFEFRVFGRVIDYAHGARAFLQQWLTPAAMAATLLLLGSAAILGAAGAPPGEAEAEIQAALLAHLSASDLCSGRLLAALWCPLVVLAVSCLFWLIAQSLFHIVSAPRNGAGAILMAHLVLLSAMIMVADVSLLGGLRRRPGRAWGRGTATGLLLTVACVAALFL